MIGDFLQKFVDQNEIIDSVAKVKEKMKKEN